MADDDDVPPLEDMSEFLAARKGPTAEPQPIAISVATTPAAAAAPVPASTVSAVAPPTSTVAAVAPAAPAAVAKAKPSSGFGGFSKGFLSGGSKPKPAAPTQPAPARDIPVLTAKKDKSDSLRLPELMEQTKSEWMTEGLLSNVASDQVLLRSMQNPRLMRAVDEFSKDGQAALKKYAQDREVMEFFQHWTKLMGSHFSALGASKPGTR